MRIKQTSIALTVAAIAIGLAGCAAPAAAPVELDDLETPPAVATVTAIGALGDSISLGVNACAEPGRCLASSWASGDDPAVASVALRVGQVSGEFPEVVNAAKDGGTVADAVARVDEVIAAQPELVVMLLGGNDACDASLDGMTSVENYRTSYSALLTQLRTGIPDVRILAMSVPDLGRLWEIGHVNSAAVDVWDESPSCGNLLGDAAATDAAAVERRDAVLQRIEEYNAVIQELCTIDAGCISDGGALHEYQFEPEEISSIDYFHPSVAGEAVIAEIAWTALEKANAQ